MAELIQNFCGKLHLWIKKNKIILSLIGVCLVIRLPLWLIYQPMTWPDTASYERLALQIRAFDFSDYDGSRTPIYPLVLLIGGLNNYVVWIIQSILGITNSILLFYIARNQKQSILTSFFIGISYSFGLNILLFEASILTETLTTFFVVLALWFFVRRFLSFPRINNYNYSSYFLMGILLSLITLTRPSLVFIIPVVLFFFIYRCVKSNESILVKYNKVFAFILPTVIIVFGWIIFNKYTVNYFGLTTITGYSLVYHSGHFIELSDSKYSTIRDIYIKNREEKIDKWGEHPGNIYRSIPEIQKATGLSDIDLSRELTNMSLDLFYNYPDLYYKSVIHAWVNSWKNTFMFPRSIEQIKSSIIKKIFINVAIIQDYILLFVKLVFLFFALKCIISVVSNKKENIFNFLVISIVLSGSVFHALLIDGPNARYSTPFQPLIIMIVVINTITWFKNTKLSLR